MGMIKLPLAMTASFGSFLAILAWSAFVAATATFGSALTTSSMVCKGMVNFNWHTY